MNNHDISVLFGEVVNQSTQLILAFDPAANKFLYSNHAFDKFCTSFNIGGPEALLNVVHPDDRAVIDRAVEHFKSEHEMESFELRFRNGSDDVKWYCVTPYRAKINRRQVFYAQAVEITREKENSAVLTKFASKKNAILHILSHELAGPIATIRNLSSLINEKLDSADPAIAKVVRMIGAINNQNLTLLNDFLNKEFLEATHVEVVKARVDLVVLLRDVVEQYQHMEAQAGKVFTFSCSTPVLLISLDAPKFQQVINNLIWNAIKFTHDKGQIDVALRVKKNRALMTVTDNGIGIPEKFHATLFDEFTPARRPGLKGEPAVGLGMFIIKTIVEWHDGTISFESTEKKGSSFTISLPID